MSMLTHEQMRDFIATHDFRSPEDVQRALKGLFAETLQAMLDGESETLQPPIGVTGNKANRVIAPSCGKAMPTTDHLSPRSADWGCGLKLRTKV